MRKWSAFGRPFQPTASAMTFYSPFYIAQRLNSQKNFPTGLLRQQLVPIGQLNVWWTWLQVRHSGSGQQWGTGCHVIAGCKSQLFLILQSYGNAKERHVVEVRCVSVTQAWLPNPGRQPVLHSICRWKSTHEEMLATDSSHLPGIQVPVFPVLEDIYTLSMNTENVKLEFLRPGNSQSHLLTYALTYINTILLWKVDYSKPERWEM